MEIRKKMNLPNLLSAYRIIALPFILFNVVKGNEDTFVILLIISFITDIADGIIARKFNLQTDFGARLDSIADAGTFLCALFGVYHFESSFIHEFKIQLVILISGYALPYVICLIRFRKFPSLHLYSAKVVAYLQSLFLVLLFTVNIETWWFWLVLVISLLSYLEESIVILMSKVLKSDSRSLYHVIKSRHQ